MNAPLGFAKAVTEAVKHDCDHWLLWMPKQHDQLDAARMRLCLDDNDAIRRCYLEGR